AYCSSNAYSIKKKPTRPSRAGPFQKWTVCLCFPERLARLMHCIMNRNTHILKCARILPHPGHKLAALTPTTCPGLLQGNQRAEKSCHVNILSEILWPQGGRQTGFGIDIDCD